MVDVSIIIIGYNIEKYVGRCIDSVTKQTLNTIEIIFVDDGSIDKTVSIVEEYKKKDKRIKIVKQDNNGPYSARIAGINRATGKYIIFVDGDDWIDNNMVKEVYTCIEKNNLNLVFFDYVKNDYINNKIYHNPLKLTNNCLIHKEEIKNTIYNSCMKNSNFSSPCNKMIRLSYLKKLIKRDKCNLKYGEDLILLLELYDKMDNTFYIPKEYYHYCINNNNSLSQIHNENAFFEIHKELFKIRYEYACKWHVEEKLYNNTSYMALTEFIFDFKKNGFKALKKYTDDQVFKIAIKNSKVKTYSKDTNSKKTIPILCFFKIIYMFK